MRLKNNSDKEWKDYNCGNGVVITIKPKSEFEVDDKSAQVLLRNLGHEKWIVQIDEKKPTEEEKKQKTEEIEKEVDKQK